MIDTLRWAGAAVVGLGLVSLAAEPGPDGPPARPRPGLTAQQSKEAVKLAEGAMVELRKKTDGASAPEADRREYVVGVELLSLDDAPRAPAGDSTPPAGGETPNPGPGDKANEADSDKPAEKTQGPRAIVTSYRYFDDITVFSTVDLKTGRVVKVEAAQHLRTPLSHSEFELAQEMARDKSDEVKRLFAKFGDQVSVYPQFSQFTVKDDPRVHRVVHLTYRVGKRDLSFPRPQVDLTTRQVETPAAAELEPEARPRRRSP
jgi:hypothetical protein